MSSTYGQFFAHTPNRPLITEEKIKELKGKPHFGDKTWQVGDTYIHCMVEKQLEDVADRHMVTLSHRHIKDVESDYEYVRMCATLPVFKKKEK